MSKKIILFHERNQVNQPEHVDVSSRAHKEATAHARVSALHALLRFRAPARSSQRNPPTYKRTFDCLEAELKGECALLNSGVRNLVVPMK